MTELYTTSRVRAHARCPRLHHLQYDLGIQTESSAVAAFGTAGHAALEVWYHEIRVDNADGALDAALVTIELSPLDAFDRAKLRVLIVGYDARWLAEMTDVYEVIGVEVEFRYDLGGYEIGGKLDVLVRRRSDGAVFVVEHKFTGSAIGDGEAYWERLAIDTQCSIYLDGASVLLGEPVAGVIYDVIGKPGQKPLAATPEADRKYTQGKGCKPCGGKSTARGTGLMRAMDYAGTFTADAPCSCCRGTGWVEAPRLYAAQRATDETVEEFEARITEIVAAAPDEIFKRGMVVRLDDELPAVRRDLLERIETIEHERKVAGPESLRARNPDQCFAYGSVCPFFAACSGKADLADPIRFPRRGAHPELAVVNP